MKHTLKITLSIIASICLFSSLSCLADDAAKGGVKASDAVKTQAAQTKVIKSDAKKEKKAAEPKVEANSKSPQTAKRVYFVSPTDQEKVKSPVKLTFGVDGMSVRPAGEDVNDKTSGHHHLIIDAEGVKAGAVVPMDKQHIHYGKGQTSAAVELSPGEHTLRLQFADGAHRSYGAKMSAAIKITVIE